jgi:SPP1 family predicted phage head-tail adaptor
MYEEFPHVVTFQISSEVEDELGGKSITWTDLKTSEAHFQPVSGKEFYESKQIQSSVQCNIYIPYDSEINEQLRVVYNGDPYYILAVLDQGGLNEVMMLKCTSKQGSQ